MRRITLWTTRRPRACSAHPRSRGERLSEEDRAPDAFAPEGIEIGHGHTAYVGSVGTGSRLGDRPAHGRRRLLVQGAPNTARRPASSRPRPALGRGCRLRHRARLRREHRGARRRRSSSPPGTAATFINDVVVTKTGAYFTDSQRPVLYVATQRKRRPARDDDQAGRPVPARRRPVQPERDRCDGERQDADRRAELLEEAAPDRPEDGCREDDRPRRLRPRRTATACSCRGGRCTSSRTGQQGRRLRAVDRPDQSDVRARTITDPALRRPDDDRPGRSAPLRRQRALRDDDADRPELPRREGSAERHERVFELRAPATHGGGRPRARAAGSRCAEARRR